MLGFHSYHTLIYLHTWPLRMCVCSLHASADLPIWRRASPWVQYMPQHTQTHVKRGLGNAQVKYTADVGREGMATKAGFFGDATFTADVRAAFAGVPRVKPQWRARYMKVLIVGESGLGARPGTLTSLYGSGDRLKQ